MTTYIKRVPQFKAVQYNFNDKTVADLFGLIEDISTWKIDECGLTITYTVIKMGEDMREETLRLRSGDWLVRDDQKELSTLSDKEFKAQYEAAPEGRELYSWNPSDFVKPTAPIRIMGVPTGTDVPLDWEPLGCGMYLVKVKP